MVVPAYRAWSTLPLVLDALGPQIGAAREAVLVISGEQCDEAEVSRRWPWLRLVCSARRLLPGEARNAGAASARGELLAFLDADAVPSRDWLDELEAALTPEVDAAAGMVENGTPDSRIGTAEYLLTFSETFRRTPRPVRHAPSASLLLRRCAFEAACGFPHGLRAGEDTVLTFPLARSGRLVYAHAACVRHMNRTEPGRFLANQRLQGAAMIWVYGLIPYPHRWLRRRPAVLIAGPLRLLALGRFVLVNPPQARAAARVLPELIVGTIAWTVGAMQASASSRRTVVS